MATDKAVVAVGVDGSAHSERALRWALDEASVHGDRLVLVHAWEFPVMAMGSYAGEAMPIFGHDDLEKNAQELLNRVTAAAEREAPNVEIDGLLVEGHPAAALVDASSDARLLVVGSRGRGGFRGMLMGSVSSSCAHHARCPLVIVPAEPAG